MLPSWLWTCILIGLIAPLHILVVSPFTETQSFGVNAAVFAAYMAVGLLWALIGDRLKVVRR